MASIVNRNNRPNNSQFTPDRKPIISVKEARKTLGKRAKGMNDADVLELINSLDEIATIIVRDFKVLKSSEHASTL